MATRFPNRTITFDQFVIAMEDNSYPQALGSFFDSKNGAACAVGQAALNLGLDESSLAAALPSVLRSFIFTQNDQRNRKVRQIAQSVRELAPKYGGKSFTVQRKDWAAIFPGYRGVTVPRGAIAAR